MKPTDCHDRRMGSATSGSFRRPRTCFTFIELLAVPGVARRAKRSTVFTLIELLVVVAIIAILASMLLPVLGRARLKAKAVICTANQKQVGVAQASYCGENDDRMPFAPLLTGQITSDSGIPRDVAWFDVLAAYLGAPEYALTSRRDRMLAGKTTDFINKLGSYYCPATSYRDSLRRPEYQTVGGFAEWFVSDYGIPTTVTAEFLVAGRQTGSVGNAVAAGGSSLARVSRAAEIAFLGETRAYTTAENLAVREDFMSNVYWKATGWGGAIQAPIGHTPNLNYLFFDSHVEMLIYPPHELDTVTTFGPSTDAWSYYAWGEPIKKGGQAAFRARFGL